MYHSPFKLETWVQKDRGLGFEKLSVDMVEEEEEEEEGVIETTSGPVR